MSSTRPALRPLPERRYEFATWRTHTVGIDYHVEVRSERHFYSVPHRLVGEKVEVRLSAGTVEVLHNGRRVASHVRKYSPGFTTDPAHMPEAHRRHAEWTPSRIVSWANQTGPSTGKLVEAILASRPHPEHGFRSCLGIIRLAKRLRDRPPGGRLRLRARHATPSPTSRSSRSCATASTAAPSKRARRSPTPATTTSARPKSSSKENDSC